MWSGPVSWEAALPTWGSASCRNRDPSWVLCSWGRWRCWVEPPLMPALMKKNFVSLSRDLLQ